eukprot:Polyplicarium_translucidae@DN2284_c0_g1_i12.p4
MTTTSRGTRRSVKGLVELPTDLIGSIIEYLDSGAVWRGLFCLSKSILALREQLFEGRRYEAREFKLIRFDPNPRSTPRGSSSTPRRLGCAFGIELTPSVLMSSG